jgi:hypothetical protein
MAASAVQVWTGFQRGSNQPSVQDGEGILELAEAGVDVDGVAEVTPYFPSVLC